MLARVSRAQGLPDQLENGIRVFEDTEATVRQFHGFRGGYVLADRTSGKMMTITLWETEADLRTSATAASELRQIGSRRAGAGGRETVEIYEVAAQV